MKKFPLDILLIGEWVVLGYMIIDRAAGLADMLGMGLFLQLPILSIVAIIWIDRVHR